MSSNETSTECTDVEHELNNNTDDGVKMDTSADESPRELSDRFSSKNDGNDVDIDDNDIESSSAGSKDSSNEEKVAENPEEQLAKAAALKEEGNNYFMKEKDFEKASRSYRRGVNAIKKLNKANSGDEQTKALLLSLNTNLSLMLSKLGKHRQSKDIASNALEIDPLYVKALYRRAVAHRKLGDTEEAITDLKACLQTEPNNLTVRKELTLLQKEVHNARKAEKAALQRAFSEGGILNDDRVEDEKSKAERLAKEKAAAEEDLKQRKQQWEDVCVSRMAKGEDAITFEDWDKERLEKIKTEEEETKRKRKEEEKKRKQQRRKEKAARKAAGKSFKDDDDDEDFTEKELAAMRGYKKTADGRVTSYFTREQSAEEKAMLDITPKPIAIDSTPQPITPTSSTKGDASSSAWNHAGTWEEKDTTDWCKSHLEKRLLQTKVEAPGLNGTTLIGTVTKVKDVTGDASVALVSGKKCYIFDLHCSVKFSIRGQKSSGVVDGESIVASGNLQLPDICSTSHDELEVEIGSWKTRPSGPNQQVANDCRLRLVSEVRESIKLWVNDFNEQY